MKTFEITFMWVENWDRHIDTIEVEAADYFDAVRKGREKSGRWVEEASRQFKIISGTTTENLRMLQDEDQDAPTD